jgi:dihydropteroate synthase
LINKIKTDNLFFKYRVEGKIKMQFKHKNLNFENNSFYIMGILNVTPDSFSDGGRYNQIDQALVRVEQMVQEGADMIDIGGESSRPFSDPVSEAEELDRTIPVIEKISSHFETIVSIDTYKSKVAEEAIKNGAEMINDISGFTFDPQMIEVAATYQPACVIMHMKGNPGNMQKNPEYPNMITDIYQFLEKQVAILRSREISDIIVDVGFGFGKTLDHNYQLLKELKQYQSLGCPVLAGISRKSMIGKVIDLPPEERGPGTIGLNTVALLNGASILRVHDIKENYQLKRVIEKYLSFDEK